MENQLNKYHPESNGRSEITNKITFNILRTVIKDKHNKWAHHLSATEFAINFTTNASTGKSPFEAMLGFQPRNIPPLPTTTNVPAALESATDFKNTTIEVRDALLKSKLNQAAQHNKHTTIDPEYQIGDKVLLSTTLITC